MSDEQINDLAQQNIALMTLLGSLIGLLRIKRILLPNEIEQIFQLADAMLPRSAESHGPTILSIVREFAAGVIENPDENMPAPPP